MSKALEIVYASAPSSEVIINTLEINHPAFKDGPIRTCQGFEDHELTLETGETVVFQGSGLDLSLPKRNATGQQNLNFAVENVTGIAQHAIDTALAASGKVDVVFRTYLHSDHSTPAEPSLKMTLIGADFQGATVQVTASYMDLIGYAWPRDRYTTEFAPGLKYIG